MKTQAPRQSAQPSTLTISRRTKSPLTESKGRWLRLSFALPDALPDTPGAPETGTNVGTLAIRFTTTQFPVSIRRAGANPRGTSSPCLACACHA
jgi:hypothetical protein